MAEDLRGIREDLAAIKRLLAGILCAVTEDIADACPHCGETDPEQIIDASVMGDRPKSRLTCRSCGKTFKRPEGQNG